MPLPLAPTPRQGDVASLPRPGLAPHAPLSRDRLAVRGRHSEKRSAGR